MLSRTNSSIASQSTSAATFVLGVDAGGTKTAAGIASTNANCETVVLGRGRSSSGNPLSVGFAEATRAIAEAVDQARAESSQPNVRISRAVLSIAGSADRETSRQLIDWAHKIELADEVAICSDSLPVLAAGTPSGCGIALIGGTGSIAYARTADGRAARFGGWGYLLGDDGSGYAIGRAAIRFALEDLEATLPATLNIPSGDGHGEGSGDVPPSTHRQPLTVAILDELGVNSVPALERSIYRNPSQRAVIASIAPLVIVAAENGEVAAAEILDEAARDLARLVFRAATVMKMKGEKIPLAITSGVLVGSRYLQIALVRELDCRGVDSDVNVVEDPLQGCLRLANPEFAALGLAWQ